MKYIYIMGRGHSGSTILDALIGNGNDVFSTGELISGVLKKEDVCSCGAKIKNCDFWRKVKQEYVTSSNYTWDEAGKKLKNQAHLKSLFKTFLGYDSDEIKKLEKINNDIFNAIGEVSEKNKMVDSSKEVTRGLFLAKYMQNGKIIHLVRNPLRILASNATRIKKGQFQILRHKFTGNTTALPFQMFSSIAYTVGNTIAELIKTFNRSKVLTVRYEDLCNNTTEELERIEEFAGLDLEEVKINVQNKKTMKIKHMIAGNGLREKGEFKFKPEKSGEKELSLFYKVIGFLITWPFMLRYKYL